VWTAALGALFFGEALSTSTVLSVVLIIAGLQLALAPRQDSEVSPRTPPRPE
jgi:drug/metabolite transporter (DMT)-like permease